MKSQKTLSFAGEHKRIVSPPVVTGGEPPEGREGGNAAVAPSASLASSLSTSPATTGEETIECALFADRVVAAAREWIGTPYVHQASVKGVGCDCLGLLRGVWRDCVGPEPEAMQPYSPDWADATGEETLYAVLKRHLDEIAPAALAPGDIALFRIVRHGPAKHCAIVGEKNGVQTLIHTRQNKRVSEEPFSRQWRRKLAYAFRL